MKKISLILSLVLLLSLFAGCAGTPVIYYTDCTCPVGSHDVQPTQPAPAVPQEPVGEGAVKTGLYIGAGIGDSKNAAADAAGEAAYDVTVAAVNVDAQGVITACTIDSIKAGVSFDATGAITSDVAAEVKTKNELGADYGMVAWGGAIAEWDAQAAALAAFAVGKTVQELREGAVDESGYAPEGSDLSTSATIKLSGYVDAIEAAAANAKDLGAQAGDKLVLSVIPGLSDSKAASAEGAGTAQLNVDAAAVTFNAQGVITSCYIDSLQAKVNFDTTGAITTDLTAPVKTKNQLGADYGMVAWGGAVAEWDAQAASFAAYVTGKTPADVAGIALNEKTAPADADLATSVTISVIPFQKLIAKAAQ